DDPSHLIFDFYKQEANKTAPTAAITENTVVAPVKKKKKKVKSKIAKLPEKLDPGEDGYKKMERKPATTEMLAIDAGDILSKVKTNENENVYGNYRRGVFDGGDPEYDRFRIKDYQVKEDSIIASQQNSYIKFPILLQKMNRFSELMKQTPEYEIVDDGTDESKETTLLVNLFNKNKMGAFFETLSYITKKYPNSKYDEIIKNVTAEAHIHLYEKDQNDKDYQAFRALYRYLNETYPDSPLAERNHLLLAYSSLQKGDGAETLRDMKSYLDKYPKTNERDRARLAMGEAYTLLNKPRDAIRVYQDLAEDSDDKNLGIEAAYRMGDVYMGKGDYKKALEVYQAVQAKYPAHKGVFGNAQYNIAEAQFWLGQYRESLDNYITFLKMFPVNRHGGFALTRIGELLEIFGANEQQIMGAFTEGYFRYPESQGSEVSRIRMLSRGLKHMTTREKTRAIEEIDSISQKSTLPDISEFTTLQKADGFSARNEYKNSLELLITYYQNNPTTAKLNVFKSRILRNISDLLIDQNKNNNFIESLNLYGKYSTTWLKNTGRIDIPYLKGVAFEKAGVSDEAKKIYKETLAKLKLITNKKEASERRVYENLPTLDQVRLRLAAVALEEKQYQDSYKYISEISTQLSASEEIEKVLIGATVSEQSGDNKKAIEYLEKLIADHKGGVEMIIKPELDLARLYMKEKNYDRADSALSVVEKNHETNDKIKDEDWSRALELRAELLYNSGQKLAAVEAYQKLLDAYESKYPLSSARYTAGKILFEEGDLRGAEKIWSALNDDTGSFYKKLASEKLNQAEWQDAYKKYIDRIPAAQDLK
ncbi:MAG: tetratricopeptide repeat protein, partial [Bdellovibrionales bacterium]|nr:tetratricopeptide repeat protein [Bdellovibrionales bacterium]